MPLSKLCISSDNIHSFLTLLLTFSSRASTSDSILRSRRNKHIFTASTANRDIERKPNTYMLMECIHVRKRRNKNYTYLLIRHMTMQTSKPISMIMIVLDQLWTQEYLNWDTIHVDNNDTGSANTILKQSRYLYASRCKTAHKCLFRLFLCSFSLYLLLKSTVLEQINFTSTLH